MIIVKMISMMMIFLSTCTMVRAQDTIITVRFANPEFNCGTQQYCLDVEFMSNIPDQQVFGMNVRFFFDDSIFQFVNFTDYQGGYEAVTPNPPEVNTSPAGPFLFNFSGPATFVNGSIQLVDLGPPPIILSTTTWSKIFSICFIIDNSNINQDTFCPPVVWDLEQDPANGGFLAGDDGVVITLYDTLTQMSYPSTENVVQYNWQYIGTGDPPYGIPVEEICLNVECYLGIALLSWWGYEIESGHQLEWETLDENLFRGFEVHRSYNGIHWSPLGFVPASGKGPDVQHYSFMDTAPRFGANLYRLKLIDMDGYFDFSNMILIDSRGRTDDGSIFIYPNPVNEGNTTICLPKGFVGENTVRILDASGHEIRHDSFDQLSFELYTGDLPSGMYFVQVVNRMKSMYARLIVQ